MSPLVAVMDVAKSGKDALPCTSLPSSLLNSPFTHRFCWRSYFPMKDGKPQGLRIKIQYVSDDWLFIEKYSVKADQKTFHIEPGSFKVERDNGIVGGSNRIWEWYDGQVAEQQLQLWDEISRSSKVTLRYGGRQYYKDRELDDDEIDRIAVVLEAYRYLGGN